MAEQSMKQWESISIDEKETLVNIDYYDKRFNFYTTNQATGNRLSKRIGTPTRIQRNEGKIFSMEWKIPFADRERIKKALSINVLISHHQSEQDQTTQEQNI